jgi:galactarate dehydratase
METPRYLRAHADDNVVLVVNAAGLSAGAEFPCGLALRDFVPEGHKAALADIAEGAPIIRYGAVIGTALRAFPRGSRIDEAFVKAPPAPDLQSLPLATRTPAPQSPLEGYTFEGFRNADGSVGTKNILGLSMSVQCVAGVLGFAVERIKKELLPRFPNVDDVVAIEHAYGCGVAINAPDAAIPIRTVQNLVRNPNLGGAVLVVSLGCEKLRPERLLPENAAPEASIVTLQDGRLSGFEAMVAAIMDMAEQRLAELDRRRRETCPASDLVVGLQCGSSDTFSGVTANPAAGFAADLLVRAGATVMFSEVTEVRDAIPFLTARAADAEVAQALIREMDWYDRYLAAGKADRSANPSTGNRKGGVANVTEKALGSIAKSGTSPIAGVLAPGERANRKGLLFAATPAGDFVCGTLQLAAGCAIEVFTTGRGTPYGLAMMPVIKVSTRTALAERWSDLIDLDAGRIATGQASVEEVGWELFHLILDVASGRKTAWADRWGLRNAMTLFNPAPMT